MKRERVRDLVAGFAGPRVRGFLVLGAAFVLLGNLARVLLGTA